MHESSAVLRALPDPRNTVAHLAEVLWGQAVPSIPFPSVQHLLGHLLGDAALGQLSLQLLYLLLAALGLF